MTWRIIWRHTESDLTMSKLCNRILLWLQLRIDRSTYGSITRQIAMLSVVTLVVFGIIVLLSVYVFDHLIGHSDATQHASNFWQIYYFFVDPSTQSGVNDTASPNASRAFAMIVSAIGTVLVSGLLIATISNIIERRVENCSRGLVYYRFTGHVLIIGSDQMVTGIVRQLCDNGIRRIVVMTSGDVEKTRTAIYSMLSSPADRSKVIVNYGTRDSIEYLDKVRVTKAKEVYILGDDNEFDAIECFHDSLNIECLMLIADLCRRDGRRGLQCTVSFDYKTTYQVFQYADLPEGITEYIDFRSINFYDYWAQRVLVDGCSCGGHGLPIKYKPLDYRPITRVDSDDYVHLIVIGLSQMGQAIALQAAHVAHYPNYRRRKTRITLIDRNMYQQMYEFRSKCGELFELSGSTFIDADSWAKTGVREEVATPFDYSKYGHLVTDPQDPHFIDIEWCFINGDDSNPCVKTLLEQYVSDPHAIITVAVCLNISHRAIRSAMHLPRLYYDRQVPILVNQRKTSTIVTTLNGKTALSRYQELRPFGMVYDCDDLHNDIISKMSMGVNAAYSGIIVKGTIDTGKAEECWRSLPVTKRWSNVFCAASIPTKLRCIGLDIDSVTPSVALSDEQVAMLAETEHNRWCVEELLLGYRTVSADEDQQIDRDKSLKSTFKTLRIHYDIRPYDGLKTDEKGKDTKLNDHFIVHSIPAIVRWAKSDS